MAKSIDEIYEDARDLPEKEKEALIERLLCDLVENVDPEIERAQLETAKCRCEEIRSGKVEPVEGEEVIRDARRVVERCRRENSP